MCLADVFGTHEVITAAATAEVPEHQPAICGTVTLHCVDGDETLRLTLPMPDALLLLNSLRGARAILRRPRSPQRLAELTDHLLN